MFEMHQHKGLWWLADNPEKTLAGTLTVTKGKSELEAIGHFGPGFAPEAGGVAAVLSLDFTADKPGRMIGSSAREDITLEGALIRSFPADIATYHPSWALIGKAFEADEEILFDEMVVELSDLDAWARISGFRGPQFIEGLPEERVSGLFDMEFARPDSIEIPFDNGEKATNRILCHPQWMECGYDECLGHADRAFEVEIRRASQPQRPRTPRRPAAQLLLPCRRAPGFGALGDRISG